MKTMDPARIGERLRVARTAMGLTQEQAAESVGMARTTLVAIEKGDREARPEELIALAKRYEVSVHSLLRSSAVKVEIVGRLRKKGRTPEGDRDAIAALGVLHDVAAAYVELERRLDKVSFVDYPPERRIGRGRIAQQAEEVAAELRARLGLGLGPITDLESILELEMGVRIFVRPLPPSVAGAYAYDPEIGACVALNKLHSHGRRRWTLARELSHFMTARYEPSVMMADATREGPDDVFADAFAAAFLMPSATVRRIFEEYVGETGTFAARHLILGARRLGVSLEDFGRRLEGLELLPHGTFDALKERGLDDKAVQRVLGQQEDQIGLEGTRLLLLAAEASEQGLYSEGQLADMLVLDRVELRRAIDAFSSLESIDAPLEARA
ncbi:MAG TPA: XRE family transcriptional regulator [Kofleriaceae bacterium]|nr:XRE family transcriptional regulator [Kofleriaceae bacterium]